MIPYLDQIPQDSLWQRLSFLLYIALAIAAVFLIRWLLSRFKPKEVVTIGAEVTDKFLAAKNIPIQPHSTAQGTGNASSAAVQTLMGVSFLAANGQRLKLLVPYGLYEKLVIGDRGRLTYQGKQFISFT